MSVIALSKEFTFAFPSTEFRSDECLIVLRQMDQRSRGTSTTRTGPRRMHIRPVHTPSRGVATIGFRLRIVYESLETRELIR